MIDALRDIDEMLLFFVQTNMQSPFLDKVMLLATKAGDRGLIWIIISVGLLFVKKTRRAGMISLCALLISTLLGELFLKNIIQRPRPYDSFPLVELLIEKSTRYSFPSGHTASSFALVYVFKRYIKSCSPYILILAVFISFSRIYLFMHYPLDVAGGVILGIFSGWSASRLFEKAISKERQRGS